MTVSGPTFPSEQFQSAGQRCHQLMLHGCGGRVGVDLVGVGVVMAFILCDEVGIVTSMTLSAISANLSKVIPSAVEASTMHTLLGNLPGMKESKQAGKSPAKGAFTN